MLFLNSRARNPTATGLSMQDRSFPHKMGHSCIIFGCLSIVTGLVLIIIGVISEVKKTIFVGIGIISLGVGFFLTTLVCFYGKLDICYNNWAYRSRVLPTNTNRPNPQITTDVERKPSQTEIVKRTESQAPITVVSDAEIQRIVLSSPMPIHANKICSDDS